MPTSENYMSAASRMGFTLQNAREDVGLTQDDVAKRLAESQEEISGYECGTRELDAGTLLRLLRLYRMPPARFFEKCDFTLLQPWDGTIKQLATVSDDEPDAIKDLVESILAMCQKLSPEERFDLAHNTSAKPRP